MANQQVYVTGWALQTAYANNLSVFTDKLHKNCLAENQAYFADEEIVRRLQFKLNPHCLLLPRQDTSVLPCLIEVIDSTLATAGLSPSFLQGKRVRFYMAGTGERADLYDFFGHQFYNNDEDRLFTSGITSLHASSYAQDQLAHDLLKHYHLSDLPVMLYNASNSAMMALHLAYMALQAEYIDVAVVIAWNRLTLQDMFFFAAQNMLVAGPVQPFNAQGHNGVLPAEGNLAMVLENRPNIVQRRFNPEVEISASIHCQSHGRKGSVGGYADFRTITSVIRALLRQADLSAKEMVGYFPHGNGMALSDKAELMASHQIWGAEDIPIVSYKGQVGYLLASSGLLDVILAIDALLQKRLIAFTSRAALTKTVAVWLYADAQALPLSGNHFLKSALGVDGSMNGMIISRV